MNRMFMKHKDFYAGLLFVGIGAAAMILGRDYPTGTSARIGPGYVPMMLATTLAVLGLVIAARSLWLAGEPVGGFALRPLLLVTASVVVFGQFIDSLGLAPVTIALVVLSSLARRRFSPKWTVGLCVLLVTMTVGIFIYGLGLPVKIW